MSHPSSTAPRAGGRLCVFVHAPRWRDYVWEHLLSEVQDR